MTFATTPTTTTAAAAAPPGLATPPGLQQQQQQQQQQTESKLVAFTNAISRVAKSPTGSAREALAMLGRMRQEGVAPTSATLNAVIDSQAKHADRDGSARVALQILDAMKNSTVRDVRPTTVTYTSAMDCLAKCSDGDARTAIDRVPILECVAAGVDVRMSCDVPQQHAEHWAEVSGAILGWLNAALRGGDARQVATATRWFFARSAILLRTVRGGRRGRAQLAARFDAFKSGRYA